MNVSRTPSRSHDFLRSPPLWSVDHSLKLQSPIKSSQPDRHTVYIHTLLNTYQPVRYLRSHDSQLLAKPPVYKSIGRQAFNYAAPQIWNATPLNIRNSPSVGSFKRNLKTYLLQPFNF